MLNVEKLNKSEIQIIPNWTGFNEFPTKSQKIFSFKVGVKSKFKLKHKGTRKPK